MESLGGIHFHHQDLPQNRPQTETETETEGETEKQVGTETAMHYGSKQSPASKSNMVQFPISSGVS